MRVNLTGYCFRHPSDFRIHRPHGSGDHLLLVVRSAATFELNGQTVHTPPGTVLLLDKGMPQMYGGDGGEFVNDWVHFEADPEEIIALEERGLEFDKILDMYDVLPLSDLIGNMFRELYSDNKNAAESAHLYFEILLNKISDMCAHAQKNANSELLIKLSRLKSDIYSEPQRDWSIPAVARALALSESYLQHSYKSFFGRSIKSDVTSSRMEYSKYLLFATDYTVSAISQLCGYQNDVHFMRTFKQSVGMTPTAYRNYSIHNKDKVDRTKNPFCL
jgi:AraC family transcriptional regulator of arabinose operon